MRHFEWIAKPLNIQSQSRPISAIKACACGKENVFALFNIESVTKVKGLELES